LQLPAQMPGLLVNLLIRIRLLWCRNNYSTSAFKIMKS
jgi:hypothetical protein